MTNASEENNQTTSSKTSPQAAGNEAAKSVSKSSEQKGSRPSFKLRLMTPDDVPQCLNIFREHELPELSYGLHTYRTLDPEGSWVAEHSETGEIIAMCYGSKFYEECSLIGFYGVKLGYQGLGLGYAVWQKVIEYLGPESNIGLCAAPAQVQLYKEKAGFVLEDPDHHMIEYIAETCTLNHITPSADDCSSFQIIPVSQDTIDSVIEYDGKMIGRNRSKLLKLSLFEPTCIAFVAVDVKDKNKVLGYGAIKMSSYEIPMVTPLYADSYDIAKVILYNLLMNCPLSLEKGAIAFALDSLPESQKLFELAGFKNTFVAPRLYTKSVFSIPQAKKVFSILSPDFGPF